MVPITFWLTKIRIGKEEKQSLALFQCNVYQDRLEVIESDQEILQIFLKDILKVKLKHKIHQYYFYSTIKITLRDENQSITLVPVHPVNPTLIAFINTSEAKKLKKAIDNHKESIPLTIEPNPYIRNKEALKFIQDFESLDTMLHPYDFYDRYFKEYDQKSKWQPLVVILFSILLSLLVVLLLLRFYPA